MISTSCPLGGKVIDIASLAMIFFIFPSVVLENRFAQLPVSFNELENDIIQHPKDSIDSSCRLYSVFHAGSSPGGGSRN